MRIIDEALLASFGGPGICEFCRKPVRLRHAHHVFSRGACRLDVAFNVVALCAVFAGGDNCHHNHHAGLRPRRQELLEIVARREGVAVEWIVEEIYRLRRLPKEAQDERRRAG